MSSEQILSAYSFFWLALVVVIAVLIYLLSPILTPFLLAAILAYMGDPLVDRLEAKKIPRTLGVEALRSYITPWLHRFGIGVQKLFL